MSEFVTPRPDLFIVTRTSAWFDLERPPCEGAILIDVPRIDIRGCDDPKKIPANKGTDGDWFLRGTNHRVENGRIRRDMGTEKAWAVDIPDLLAFVKKYGHCVVSLEDSGFGKVEIYDDYRE